MKKCVCATVTLPKRLNEASLRRLSASPGPVGELVKAAPHTGRLPSPATWQSLGRGRTAATGASWSTARTARRRRAALRDETASSQCAPRQRSVLHISRILANAEPAESESPSTPTPPPRRRPTPTPALTAAATHRLHRIAHVLCAVGEDDVRDEVVVGHNDNAMLRLPLTRHLDRRRTERASPLVHVQLCIPRKRAYGQTGQVE